MAYELVRTDDGSMTVRNPNYDEFMHSTSGAAEEAMKKYVEPAHIAEKSKSGALSILDIGFGFGINSAAAIKTAIDANPECSIKIVGLEKDEIILDMLPTFPNPFGDFFTSLSSKKNTLSTDNLSIRLFVGDATKTIQSVTDKFDVVFVDAHSPTKNPELWSPEFIQKIGSRCVNGAILATYSCARRVRDALQKAGFEVQDGPRLHRRGPSTIAIKGD